MHQNSECHNVVLPFFPKYAYECLCDNKLRVTWFEPNFSQSRYNFDKSNVGSNACTIIVILIAAKCYVNRIHMFGPDKHINYFLVKALGESILEGNDIHRNLKNRGALSNINLTVPEGIKSTSMKELGLTEWKCNLYMQPLGLTLYKNLKAQWSEWDDSNLGQKYQHLFVILISDARSVLFVLNDPLETITLIDSHQHTSEKGAVVATATRQKMKYLCNWFTRVIYNCYKSTPLLYELSFLYFKRRGDSIKKWKTRLRANKWKIFGKAK